MLDIPKLRSLALRVSPSGRFLERAESGQSFFPFADTAWEIFHRCTKEEAIQFLDKRQSQGFNSILAVLVPELDVKGHKGRLYQGEVDANGQITPESQLLRDRPAVQTGSKVFFPNRYGEVPFINDDPAKPNEAFFAFVDWVVDAAARRGILIWLVPTWSRFVNTGWADGPIIFDETNARSYGRFLGERYPFLPKLLGGDSLPIWTNGYEALNAAPKLPFEKPIPPGTRLPNPNDLSRNDTSAVWDAMAAGLEEGEGALWKEGNLGKPFLTYHPCPVSFEWTPKAVASNFFGDREWLVFDACQSGHADAEKLHYYPPIHRWDARASHEPIKMMWDAKPARPVIDLESHYEEAFNALQAGSSFSWDGDDIRSGAWQSVLSGACGIVYGCNVVWQMYDPALFNENPHCFPVCGTSLKMSWKTSLDLPGPRYLRIMHDYFSSLLRQILESRIPAQEVLVSSECPSNWSNRDGRIDIMRDRGAHSDRSTWLLAHSGRGYAFVLDLTKAFELGSKLSVSWIDPRSGEKRKGEGITAEQGETTRFEPPSGGGVKDDWLLEIMVVQ